MAKNAATGQPFYKMTGSGNDFVVFDATRHSVSGFEQPAAIQTLSARGTGIGADGVVFLEKAGAGDIRMRYYNSDGSEAALCGNASLCSTRLAVELGLAKQEGFILHTAAGALKVRIRDGVPEIDLEPVTEVRPDSNDLGIKTDEKRLGYARAGVPHVIVEVGNLEAIDLKRRGRELRNHSSLSDGANVNFVAGRPDGSWAYRTYERGVEGETLACGTGAVAAAIILSSWGESRSETTLWTRSGLPLTVTLRRQGDAWLPSLRGEGRIVFEGRLREVG
ncbi:MAG TPA: diaminopimelate epimerase [Gemmatimonadaceae bacterium]|nr:diaminopimelate epimerase [Gemmatimonadaceae bacterium]